MALRHFIVKMHDQTVFFQQHDTLFCRPNRASSPPYEQPLNSINDPCSLSYKNQSTDLQYKSIDWFLYDGEH